MSKAIQGAALLGIAAAATVVMTGGLSLAGIMALTSMQVDILGAIALGGVAMEAGAIAEALTANRGMNITTRSLAAPRQIILGEQRVGGVEVYRSTTGSKRDQFNYIIVIATHECESIVNLYLDGRQVHWHGSGAGYSVRNGVGFGGIADSSDHIGPGGAKYNFGGTGHSGIYCEARYGDQTETSAGPSLPAGYAGVIGGLTANDPHWAASGGKSPWLGGCCYVYLKIEYNPNVFPGEPEIRFTVRGKNDIYDPRDGTRKYTNNWALLAADVITDPVWGLGDNTVNTANLIAAANICDERVDVQQLGTTEARYCTNWHYDTTVGPGNALSTMMEGAAGRLSRIGGEWYLWPAHWQGPSFNFDQGALTGTPTWSPNRSKRDLFNRVRGTYVAPSFPWNDAGNEYDANGWYDNTIDNTFPFAFQPTDYPEYACDTLHGYGSDVYTADDGEQLPKNLSFATVLSVTQAQRVAKITLMRNRQQGTGTFPMSLAAWAMQPIDVMQFSWPYMGWSNKVLEIVSTNFHVDTGHDAPTVRVEFGVAETSSAVYAWDPSSEELTVYDVPANASRSSYTPEAPTALVLTSDGTTAVVGRDGVIQPRILASWTAPADARVVQVQVQLEVSGSGTWLDEGAVDAATTSMYIGGVIAGTTYDVRVRSLLSNGATSDWLETDGVLAASPNSLQASYSIAPQFPLTQPTSTSIAVAAVAATFGSATVNYAARTLTISAPGSPTWYYVSITDATQQGESGSPTLTATASTTTSLVGVQGHTYLGAILALPAGSATRSIPGGWPAPSSSQVGV